MKNFILIISVSVPFALCAQQQQLFVHPSAKWYVADTYPNGSQEAPAFIETMTSVYHYEDTMIDGEYWRSMFRTTGPSMNEPLLEGWVRAQGDMVFFIDTTQVLDTLYDFSLQVGDTIPYEIYVGDPPIYLHVSQVDTVVINGNDHRVIHFQEPFIPMDVLVERWIEGIGSIHGPLFPKRPRAFATEVPGDSLMLTCFSLSDTLYWQHPAYADCEANIIQHLNEVVRSNDPVLVWPNPGRDQVTIEIGWDLQGSEVLEVYSSLGVLVRTVPTLRTVATLDMRDLPAGAYSIHINGPYGRRSVRWVKY